jgi:hypothetical protein
MLTTRRTRLPSFLVSMAVTSYSPGSSRRIEYWHLISSTTHRDGAAKQNRCRGNFTAGDGSNGSQAYWLHSQG